ncbi:PAS domain-containing sensor histidine kinase [Sunxiuqinia indica]|uniref:PAS domain-containing sensor histidine kinase n=1 Tax=Sunxiuqinia indica TaxID=2692584 RepID=UPI00135AECDD|nr:PAS domain-containing sensor histidine kinase [Sunxiuqinia indica]
MKLTKRVLTFLILIFSVIIVVAANLFYLNIQRNIHKEKAKDLATISQFKINELIQWRKERFADIKLFSNSTFFGNAVLEHIEDRPDSDRTNYLLERLSIPREEYGYQSVFLVTPEYQLLLSSTPSKSLIGHKLMQQIDASISTGRTTSTDFYFSEKDSTILYDIIAPITASGQSTPIAAIVFRIDPARYLYPLIQSWPTPSKTAESLLIRKDDRHVLFLNELRHQKETALKLRIPLTQETLPAVVAAQGYTGIVEGIDYRNEKVMAYVGHIPETNWYIVAKVDTKELFQQAVTAGTFIFVTTSLIILSFVIGLILFYNLRQKKIFKTLWKTQEEFKTTLYSIGDGVITVDKSGKLKQINKVAESLTGWTEQEAKHKPLESVFNIVNEYTREKAHNPVDTVLEQGVVVGLANHTMLISKNGTETPIADSAAPIRGADGNILGVVLVFRDQTEEKQHLREIESARNFAESIINSLQDYLFVLDDQFKVISTNQYLFKKLKLNRENVINQLFFEILDESMNDEMLKDHLSKLCSENLVLEDYELTTEMGSLGSRHFRINARAINSSDNNTKNIIVTLTDITDKVDLIRELTIAKEQAEESNKLKSAFLANMSHEIRTPLNGILGFSSMMADKDLAQKEKIRFNEIIEKSSAQLLNIINDILDISMIQSNQLPIRLKECNPKEILEDIELVYQTTKKDKLESVQFIVDHNLNDDFRMKTDKDRLYQILKNLLDNAFKFTKKGKIVIGAEAADHQISFFVKDSGSGIPKDKYDFIFESFHQTRNQDNQKVEGAGLGLAIAKGLTERLGGKIWVESEASKGSNFIVRFTLN